MINKIGIYTAIITFILGAFLFINFYFFHNSWPEINVLFKLVIITGLINVGILVKLLFKIFNDKNNRMKYLITFGIMFLNIPIGLIYYYFIVVLIGKAFAEF